MNTWFLDFETASSCDIDRGAYRYASDPSTKILLCALARNDEAPVLWDVEYPETSDAARAALKEMSKDDGIVVAHSVQFEIPISHYLFESTFGCPPPALERWRCTQAMARRACIPQSLKACAEFLKLDERKADCGKALIKYFSVPMAKEPKHYTVDGKHLTREQAWKLFSEYCVQDVVVERQIWHKLKAAFDLDNHPLVRDSFLFDIRLNHRGVPVNLKTLRHANQMVERCMGEVNREFMAITGLKVTQVAKVTGWFRERGYGGENLQALTMEKVLENPEHGMKDDAYRALQLRAGGAFAALAKIPTMIEVACPDGRARGQFMWWGATPGRWSSKGIQLQNVKRPTIKQTHLAYDMLKWGCDEEALEIVFGEVPETLSSCVRHFVEQEGEVMMDGDFANIEARITPWLVGETDLLEQFRNGEPVYEIMGSFIFSVPVSKVTKQQRFVGKQGVLACQYSVSWKKFQVMCAKYRQDLDDETCKLAVKRYREKCTRIVESWRELTDAMHEAILHSGRPVVCNRCTFLFGNLPSGFKALQIKLPSGRRLTYPLAHLKMARRVKNSEGEWVRVVYNPHAMLEGEVWDAEEVRFWGQNKITKAWGWQATWGGKILENLTQGTAGDFLSHAMLLMEERSIEPFMTVHDQVLALKGGHSLESFQECMETLPKWAEGFPLAASCSVQPHYTKDD